MGRNEGFALGILSSTSSWVTEAGVEGNHLIDTCKFERGLSMGVGKALVLVQRMSDGAARNWPGTLCIHLRKRG